MKFARYCAMMLCLGAALNCMAQEAPAKKRATQRNAGAKSGNRATSATLGQEKITTGLLTAGKIKGVNFRGDVDYLGGNRAEKLDVYLPAQDDGKSSRPVIVMIHGGGWVGGDKAARRELQSGVTFARAGYVAVSVEYKKGKGCWPTNLHDCKNAVRWVRTHAGELNADTENIGVIGGSAGGHLALMVAYTGGDKQLAPASSPYPGVDDSVKAVVNLYGITNLVTRQSTDKTGKPNGDLRGGGALTDTSRQEAPDLWKLLSPVSHVTSSTPPTFTLHGSADTTVDRDQAYELDRTLKTAGAESKLMVIDGAPHSFILKDARLKEDLRPAVLGFFDKHLRGGIATPAKE